MLHTFISHSYKDNYFVTLLHSVLEFHGVEAWCSFKDIGAGKRFPAEIKKALNQSESLLVVVSRHSMGSGWVSREAAFFRAKHPTSSIIPLILERSQANGLLRELAPYQSIDFSRDMKAGFERLLDAFGREFLEKVERRNAGRRRTLPDRRTTDNRRRAPVLARLRSDFWHSFASRTDVERQEALELTATQLHKTVDALLPEASRYTYQSADGTAMKPRKALEEVAEGIWKTWRDKERVKAEHVIDAVAERIQRSYHPTPGERRVKARRSGDDRRDQSNERRAQGHDPPARPRS